MRAMNKYRRNLGIIAYPQQYESTRQFGGGKPFSWTELGKQAASAVGRQLATSAKKEAKDFIESGKLQKSISSFVDSTNRKDSEEEEEEEEEEDL